MPTRYLIDPTEKLTYVTFPKLEWEGWKIEKMDLPGRLASLDRPVTAKYQETFLLRWHIK